MKNAVIVIGLWLLASAGGAGAQIVVIVHKEAPADSLSHAQLLDFYSGEVKKWSDKTPVVIFDLKPQSDVKELFYRFLGKSPSRMKSIWLKKLLMGEGEPPQALASEEEMVRKVAATRGAIGFISKAKIQAGVKAVLTIAGAEP
ncbi:substrate-binding domain-containing protein [candidate division KSB1 bacterium]|nr:substrate-binding domain-containing protein [bacterium]NUM67159.1 substrate-binding domain-containing protein [candidate division KSB1 bacterium]